jgi:NAD-dependent SIR2 family protein deacetylase
LSPRAGHPQESLKLLHGSLFDVKCSEFFCKYFERNNYTDPIVPALAIPTEEDPTTNEAIAARELDIADENVDLPELTIRHLPRCPSCKKGLLRPGVVWFGEMLPKDVLQDIETWMGEEDHIDLIMVIGTSAKVYPAAGYVDIARERGARVAVINIDRSDAPSSGMYKGDWFFEGDAAQILPELLKDVTGELKEEQMKDLAEGRT